MPDVQQVENLRYVHGSHLFLALECTARGSRPAVRPRASHAGRRICWWFAPRLTALGLDGGRAMLMEVPYKPNANR